MGKEQDIKKCRATLKRLVYPRSGHQAGDWGTAVLTLVEDIEGKMETDKNKEFKIRGNLPSSDEGALYTFCGEEIHDEKWGIQYETVFMARWVNQSDIKAEDFLRVILTDTQFEAINEALDNPAEVISSGDIKTLTSIKGIGAKTALKIINKWNEAIDYSSAYIRLYKYGVSKSVIDKLVEHYKSPDTLIDIVEEDPYILVGKAESIGFKKIDEIALKLGNPPNAPNRIRAVIRYCLDIEANQGNSWISPSYLSSMINEYISDIDKDVLKKCFHDLYEKEEIWWDEKKTRVALTSVMSLEKNIAEELIRIFNADSSFESEEIEDTILALQEEQGWEYTDEQREAIRLGLNENLLVVTGGGGVGKTTIVKATQTILHPYPFFQCALAGKAAKRMAEVTGVEGYTIHRLLGWEIDGFNYNANNQLPVGIYVLDEGSMVGGILFYQLIQAIPNGAKLIISGDQGQLEAIGLLSVFKDMIDSQVVPTRILTKIHRQAAKSAIITDSMKVRYGEQLFEEGFIGSERRGELQDLLLDVHNNKDLSGVKVLEHFKQKLAEHNGDVEKIQVIAPMKTRGTASVFELNRIIQNYYNPQRINKEEIQITKQIGKDTFIYFLREGDKVVNRKNNYRDVANMNGVTIPIFNGSVGIIKSIDMFMEEMVVEFPDDGELIIPKKLWKNFDLGYALTVHSVQGSQWHTVIFSCDFNSYSLLTRELIYTALTRAEKECIVVAEGDAFRYAISTSRVPVKQTFLKEFLRNLKNTGKAY